MLKNGGNITWKGLQICILFITHGDCLRIWAKIGKNPRRQHKSIPNFQGYTFRILQYFGTKICSFTIKVSRALSSINDTYLPP